MLFSRKKKRRTSGNTPKGVIIKQIFIGCVLITVIGLIGWGVWHGTRIDSMTISSITVSGGETIPHDEVRSIVEEKLEGAYFRLVPHRFAWTYPEASIRTALVREPRIKDVSIDRTSGTELSVVFSEHHPSALWCTSVDDTACLFLDETGYAFGPAPQLAGTSFLRFSDPTREPAIGEYAFDVAVREQFFRLAGMLEERHGFTIFHVEQTAPDETVYYAVGGGAFKVSERVPVEVMLENLETILTSPEFEHLAPGNFGYIDLRYGDKVFVNENVGELIMQEETATSTDAIEE